jgi:type I restriction enzyme, S subunit
MKAGWQIKPLDEVCQFKPPKSEARNRLSATEMVSFAPMEDLGVEQKFFKAAKTKALNEVAGSYTYFADGDVLLAKITPCFENGKLGIAENLVNGIGFGSSEYVVFRPSPAIDKEYLYYFLARQSFREEGAARMSGAVGHKRVSKEFIESYPIPVPPLPEQKRIVTLLDEAFAHIATAKANAEQNLQNARTLFESHLQSVFSADGKGWKVERFGDLATFRNGVNFTKSSSGQSLEILGVKDFQQHFWAPTSSLDVVTIEGELSESDLLQENDILFVRSNGNPELIGRCLLIGTDFGAATFSGFTIRARLNCSSVEPIYLCHFLKSQNARRTMIDGGNGVSIRSLNQGTLASLAVPFPPKAVQAKIVLQLEKLSTETQHLESLYQQKLSALDALKKSLLHQAFSGQL